MAGLKVLIKGEFNEDILLAKLYPGIDAAACEQSRASEEFKKQYAEYKEKFTLACQALGKAVAENGHTVMVGVPNWQRLKDDKSETAAKYVIPGVNQAIARNWPNSRNRRNPVIFFVPQDPEPVDTTDVLDSIGEFRGLANVEIHERFMGSNKFSGIMIMDVVKADEVILLGGDKGTEAIGYAAYSMGKPVIPLTAFGGAAAIIAQNLVIPTYTQQSIRHEDIRSVMSHWETLSDKPDKSAQELDQGSGQQEKKPFTKEDATARNENNANRLVGLLSHLSRSFSEKEKRPQRILWVEMAFLFACIWLWIYFFLNGGDPPNANKFFMPTSMFMVMLLASLLGTGLRTLLSYQSEGTLRLTWTSLLIEYVISLVLALGLVLIYFIGGISFNDQVIGITTGNDRYHQIALSMSILGLAAGFIVPVNELRKRLENTITSDNQDDLSASR
ncbi:MAG: hypothetical protein H6672_11365 [Anaerolineaceae bacterium]|nr:hypothetical protein [Anaerolineaceae bacterium]